MDLDALIVSPSGRLLVDAFSLAVPGAWSLATALLLRRHLGALVLMLAGLGVVAAVGQHTLTLILLSATAVGLGWGLLLELRRTERWSLRSRSDLAAVLPLVPLVGAGAMLLLPGPTLATSLLLLTATAPAVLALPMVGTGAKAEARARRARLGAALAAPLALGFWWGALLLEGDQELAAAASLAVTIASFVGLTPLAFAQAQRRWARRGRVALSLGLAGAVGLLSLSAGLTTTAPDPDAGRQAWCRDNADSSVCQDPLRLMIRGDDGIWRQRWFSADRLDDLAEELPEGLLSSEGDRKDWVILQGELEPADVARVMARHQEDLAACSSYLPTREILELSYDRNGRFYRLERFNQERDSIAKCMSRALRSTALPLGLRSAGPLRFIAPVDLVGSEASTGLRALLTHGD